MSITTVISEERIIQCTFELVERSSQANIYSPGPKIYFGPARQSFSFLLSHWSEIPYLERFFDFVFLDKGRGEVMTLIRSFLITSII